MRVKAGVKVEICSPLKHYQDPHVFLKKYEESGKPLTGRVVCKVEDPALENCWIVELHDTSTKICGVTVRNMVINECNLRPYVS